MNHSYTQFQIAQARAASLQQTMTAILMIILALFVSALLPSLLVRYVFASEALFEPPAILELIPVAAFVIGVLYFILTIAMNFRREMMIRQWEKDLATQAMTWTTTEIVAETTSWNEDIASALDRVEKKATTRTSGARRGRPARARKPAKK